MKKIIVIIFTFFSLIAFSQTNMTAKEAFFYALNVNNFKPDDVPYGNMGTSYQWIDLYAMTFDNTNYINSKNDEFKRKPYRTQIFQDINNGVKSVDFNKIFSYTAITELGSYDMELGIFPVNSEKLLDFPSYFNFDGFGFRIMIGKMFNYSDFNYVIKMKQQQAESFIASRKDNYGDIDRSITAKITFNVVDKNLQYNIHKVYFGIYVHKIEFFNGSVLLDQIIPKNDYFDKVNFIKSKDELIKKELPTVKDIDGNIYHYIKLGTQIWMVENLKTTKFNDGTNILNITDNVEWSKLKTPGYCLYNNDISNKNTYGALYNWYTVKTGKLAPVGWHIPSNAEWETLVNFLGGLRLAGYKMINGEFLALPGGDRSEQGAFLEIGKYGRWWSSTNYYTLGAYLVYISFTQENYMATNINTDCKEGLSVRCILHDFSQLDNQNENNTQVKTNDTNSSNLVDEESYIFMVVDSMPAFPGGDSALYKYLYENIKYPQMAKEKGIQGRVFVTFVIERDGSVMDVKVLRGIGGGCDEEAIRVVKGLPKWAPGKQSGKSVRVQYNLPVKFTL